jgi:glycosyltransferase involved in cell wall biosynthesis
MSMDKQLRICMIAFQYAPNIGGAQTRAANQAQQLQECGHKVIIITLQHEKQWKKHEMINGIQVIRVGGLFSIEGRLRVGRLGHLPVDVLLFIQLWRMRHQYDILHSIQISPLSAVATLIGKLTGKPVIISIPSTGPGKVPRLEDAVIMADTLTDKLSDSSFLQVPYADTVVGDITHIRKTAFGGDLILAYLKKSDAFYQILSSRSLNYMTSNGFRAKKIAHIPNGIEIKKFTLIPELRPDPEQPERDILCVARLQYPKGVDVLLHAWKRMLSAPDHWRTQIKPRLLLAGGGPAEGQLKRLARELELGESVIFLGSYDNVIPLLHTAWGFVLPSRWEGMPNALLEAMSCEVPCIATRVSGSEDILINGINGLLVETEQPAELAQALQQLISDTTLAKRLALAGRATILKDYQLAHITDQLIQFYRQTLIYKIQIKTKVLEIVGEN